MAGKEIDVERFRRGLEVGRRRDQVQLIRHASRFGTIETVDARRMPGLLPDVSDPR